MKSQAPRDSARAPISQMSSALIAPMSSSCDRCNRVTAREEKMRATFLKSCYAIVRSSHLGT